MKLADFGTAKKIADVMNMSTGLKSLVGTPYMMAPEVIYEACMWISWTKQAYFSITCIQTCMLACASAVTPGHTRAGDSANWAWHAGGHLVTCVCYLGDGHDEAPVHAVHRPHCGYV